LLSVNKKINAMVAFVRVLWPIGKQKAQTPHPSSREKKKTFNQEK
jgi:hypothetical protein